MTTLPPIKGFIESSFLDWPGRVAAVAFLPGCNFRCPYCHNHKLVLEPENFETWPLDGILAKLGDYEGWIDGVCVTGGEPTIQAGLPDLLGELKSRGLAVKLDTNASRPQVLETLLQAHLLDAVAVDVKAPLEPVPYRRNAGQGSDPEAVRESLQLLNASKIEVALRTTVHPALLSLEECVRLADQTRRLVPRAKLTLQRGRVENVLDPALAEKAPLSAEEFGEWVRRVASRGQV
ncbi:MAG: anaerobic ribonucleoside-triphosphate reductase activating protein [Deltaproteobacteria bacterium]|nr:anaerobic ribonucleoside-triphosphate reductase activating protein [Deltaproteobacteria bacterium]